MNRGGGRTERRQETVHSERGWTWVPFTLKRLTLDRFPPRASGRLIHGGQLLNGLAGPTVMSAGPLLSTTWFAPDQRATATAVATLVPYLGSAASFLLGPLLVPAPNDSMPTTARGASGGTPHDLFIRDRIQLLMYSGKYPQQPSPPPSPRW